MILFLIRSGCMNAKVLCLSLNSYGHWQAGLSFAFLCTNQVLKTCKEKCDGSHDVAINPIKPSHTVLTNEDV